MGLSGNNTGSEVYVTVEADASTPMLMNDVGVASPGQGGGGEISKDFIVRWEYEGGITAQYGWTVNGNTITPDPNSIETTNSRVSAAISGMSLFELNAISKCVFGT